ncbi:small GTPase superfamily, partial [Cyathus striatus]
YDVSNRQSYDALKQWYKKIEHQVDKYNFKIVIGNKVDGLRQVTTAEGQQFASSIGWAFLEASAKTSLHITDVISLVV